MSTWLLPTSITLVQLIWFILNFLIHFHCYQTAFCFEIRAVLDLFWRFPNSVCVWLNKVDSITQHMIVHISDHIDKTSWGKKRETTPAEGKTKRPGVHGDESLSSQKIPVSWTWANAYQLILQQAACAMCKTAHICSWDLGSLSVLDALLIQDESLNNIWIVKHFVNKNLISVKTGKQCTHCDGYAKSNWTIKLNWEAQFH